MWSIITSQYIVVDENKYRIEQLGHKRWMETYRDFFYKCSDFYEQKQKETKKRGEQNWE